jgi:hypothetical protein
MSEVSVVPLKFVKTLESHLNRSEGEVRELRYKCDILSSQNRLARECIDSLLVGDIDEAKRLGAEFLELEGDKF